MADSSPDQIPLLLLKTKSSPKDAYEEWFSALDRPRYAPVFIPVLEHQFNRHVLNELREQILSRRFTPASYNESTSYGALIFTSQRAVEAFAVVVAEIRKIGNCSIDELLPKTLVMYVVGPATARGLQGLNLSCPILGESTGNGELLAAYILQHYNSIYPSNTKPLILFPVGDKRRDVIPKTLQSKQLEQEKQLTVNEVVIYETREMQSFKVDLSTNLQNTVGQRSKCQWIVVFSPTGCQAMLDSLHLLDAETGKAKSVTTPRKSLIAAIGPTTRDYLINEFDFAPDVCAEKPSPQGLAAGIEEYYKQHG